MSEARVINLKCGCVKYLYPSGQLGGADLCEDHIEILNRMHELISGADWEDGVVVKYRKYRAPVLASILDEEIKNAP